MSRPWQTVRTRRLWRSWTSSRRKPRSCFLLPGSNRGMPESWKRVMRSWPIFEMVTSPWPPLGPRLLGALTAILRTSFATRGWTLQRRRRRAPPATFVGVPSSPGVRLPGMPGPRRVPPQRLRLVLAGLRGCWSTRTVRTALPKCVAIGLRLPPRRRQSAEASPACRALWSWLLFLCSHRDFLFH